MILMTTLPPAGDGRHGKASRVADFLERSQGAAAWRPAPLIVCSHCGTRGHVQTRQARRKRGVSGGKATGALLTGGASLLATGLSRKVTVTEARCAACGITSDLGETNP